MMTSESVPPKPLEVSIQDQEKAEEYKKQANDFYAKGNFEAAIQFYSNAISLNPTVAAFYSNRSIANFKLEFYGAALADASAAIEIDSRYVKGAQLIELMVLQFLLRLL
jgi:serine/threonine-protein phosphatase 5